MTNYKFIILIYLLFLNEMGQCQISNQNSLLNGVLVCESNEGKYKFSKEIVIFDKLKNQYAKIVERKNDEEKFEVVYANKIEEGDIQNIVKRLYPSNDDGRKFKIACRAFYPDYSILIFDASIRNDSSYLVLVNGIEMTINKASNLKFYTWKDFLIQKVSLGFTELNPLKTKNQQTSLAIPQFKKYKNYTFDVISIDGDWVNVKISTKCGISTNVKENIIGWGKWKDNQKIIAAIYYTCY